MNGSLLLVMLDLGTVLVPDYQVVGCQRDATFEEASDTIDNSCKSSRSMRVEPGRYSSTVTLDFLYVANRSDFLKLKNANRDGEMVILARQEDGVIVQRANAKIDSMSASFPDQAESVISSSFTVDGEILNLWVIGVGVIGSVFIG